MLPVLTAIAIPIGTSIATALSYVFRYSVIAFASKAAIFAAISIFSYYVVSSLIPSWFSLSALQGVFTDLPPYARYGLSLTSSYTGMPMLATAFASAWILRKLPPMSWWGAMFRLTT